MFNNFFLKNRAVYEIMWKKNMAEPDRPQMTTRRMSFACRMTKAINTHSELVILRAFLSPKIFTRTLCYVTLHIYYLSCIVFTLYATFHNSYRNTGSLIILPVVNRIPD